MDWKNQVKINQSNLLDPATLFKNQPNSAEVSFFTLWFFSYVYISNLNWLLLYLYLQVNAGFIAPDIRWLEFLHKYHNYANKKHKVYLGGKKKVNNCDNYILLQSMRMRHSQWLAGCIPFFFSKQQSKSFIGSVVMGKVHKGFITPYTGKNIPLAAAKMRQNFCSFKQHKRNKSGKVLTFFIISLCRVKGKIPAHKNHKIKTSRVMTFLTPILWTKRLLSLAVSIGFKNLENDKISLFQCFGLEIRLSPAP